MLCLAREASVWKMLVAHEDRRRQVFYRRDRPASLAVTLILLALWLLLAVYLITHPDLISIIVLVVTALVAGFAVFVSFVVRRAESEQPDDLTYMPSRDMANGHHRNIPTANDALHPDANTMQREIPDEGGENP
jgi:Ca2+/Na+ antiporter